MKPCQDVLQLPKNKADFLEKFKKEPCQMQFGQLTWLEFKFSL